MATVTGLTAARMLEIEAASVVDGEVSGSDLILTKHDGSQINAGNVRGPQGPVGDTGGNGRVSARATRSTPQTINSGAVTALAYNSELWDSSSIHSISTNTERLVAPVDGIYLVTLSHTWQSNATGSRYCDIQKTKISNAVQTVLASDRRNQPGFAETTISTIIELLAGDYVISRVSHDSGVALAIQPEFAMARISV